MIFLPARNLTRSWIKPAVPELIADLDPATLLSAEQQCAFMDIGEAP